MNNYFKIKTALKFLKTRFINQQPFILTHLVTTKCNALCQTCLWRDNKIVDMPISLVKKMYQEARLMGFLYLGIWGGEPLLRIDIEEILSYAKSLGFYITLFTNGFLLPDKASKIAKFIDILVISLDFPDSRHDQFRGLPNLSERVKEGIKAVKQTKKDCIINLSCTLTQLNKGSIKSLVYFAQNNQVGIIFGGMIVGKNNHSLALSVKERQIIGQEIINYKKLGYPILNTDFNLRLLLKKNNKKFCAYSKFVLSINSDGLINPSCVPVHKIKHYLSSYPNLSAYLNSTEFKNWQKKVEFCNYCQECLLYQETNALWNINIKLLLDLLKKYLNISKFR